MEQKNNSVSSAGTNDEVSTNVEVSTSSPNNAKPNVGSSALSISSKFDVNVFVAEIENGFCISPYHNYPNGGSISSDKLIMAKDLLVFDLSVIIKKLQNVIDKKEELTRLDYGFSRFKELFENYVHHFNTGNFVNSFEAALKLKLYITNKSCFNSFISDSEYCLAIEAVCLKITSTYFKALELLEDKGTFEGLIPIKKIDKLSTGGGS
jgi:hypothetical protein